MKSMPIPCTREEMDALVKAAEDNEFYYTLFMLARTTGRRLGEIYEIQAKDFDFDKGIFKTCILKRRKPIEKEAIMTPEISRMMNQYINKNHFRPDDYIFKKVTYRNIQYMTSAYGMKARINHRVSFHNFRHYFITELVRKGWSYDKIAKLTGHSSPATLVNYDHAVASDIKEDALEALKDM